MHHVKLIHNAFIYHVGPNDYVLLLFQRIHSAPKTWENKERKRNQNQRMKSAELCSFFSDFDDIFCEWMDMNKVTRVDYSDSDSTHKRTHR